MDEPTSGVDPISRVEIRSLIEALKADGKTVIITSHDLSEIEKCADDVSMIKMADCCLIRVFKKCKDNHWKKSLLRRAIGMSNMGKGAGYYLTRSKSLLIDTAIVAILAIL